MPDKTGHIRALFEKQHLEADLPPEAPFQKFPDQEPEVQQWRPSQRALCRIPSPSEEAGRAVLHPYQLKAVMSNLPTSLSTQQSSAFVRGERGVQRSPAPRPSAIQSQRALGRAVARGRCFPPFARVPPVFGRAQLPAP